MTSMPNSNQRITSREEIDKALSELQASSPFAQVPLLKRVSLVDNAINRCLEEAQAWANAGCLAKGIPLDSSVSAEEWWSGPYVVVRQLRLMRDALLKVANSGRSGLPLSAYHMTSAGKVSVAVFPCSTLDSLLFSGVTAELILEEGFTIEDAFKQTGSTYISPPSDKSNGVHLILAAGNNSSIGPLDLIAKLLYEHRHCVLKMNPVNDYLGPIYEKIFVDFVTSGWLKVVYGGADVGAYLCSHPSVSHIHITGSHHTYDSIVWGSPAERESRKASNSPVNSRPITSELGCVSPIIIVPGKWSDYELDFQAENIVTSVYNNVSFNCNAGKVLVMCSEWPQRSALMTRVKSILAALPSRTSYYPGASERHASFIAAHPDAILVEGMSSSSASPVLPFVIIENVDSSKSDEMCFLIEPFCPVLSETCLSAKEAGDDVKNSLSSEDVARFISRAVTFCNDKLFGSLSCNVLISNPQMDPRKDTVTAAAFEDALENLRYGGVSVNSWAASIYALGSTTWGAYPGNSTQNIGSGSGFVHNTYGVPRPTKSILRGPLTVSPKPAFFPAHRRSLDAAKKMVAFEASPSWFRLPSLLVSAIRP